MYSRQFDCIVVGTLELSRLKPDMGSSVRVLAARLLGDGNRAGSCLGLSTERSEDSSNLWVLSLGTVRASGADPDMTSAGSNEARSPGSTPQGVLRSPSLSFLSVAQLKTRKHPCNTMNMRHRQSHASQGAD